MATLQTQSTNGAPLTVVYPAEKPIGHSKVVRFRVGKKTVLPAYTNTNLPYLVQFQVGQTVIMFGLGDIFEASYWRRIQNAYNIFGQLDLAADVKVGVDETGRIARWLLEQSAAFGVDLSCSSDGQ
jgi:hypothetical protein